jgi:putative ABC transport system permease protein
MGLSKWFRRGPSAEEMREEVAAHLALRAAHDRSDPASASRRLGNALQTQEEMRRVWIPQLWDTLVQDIHFTWRTWARNPGFALTAVLVLALGLGASTALFSALDRILFRSLPYPNADRLVSVGLMAPLDANEFLLGYDYTASWRPAPAPFESVTGIVPGGYACDLTEQQPVRLDCLDVEANLLRVLGVKVVAGRDFTSGDDAPGAPRVALIRHSLWLQRFGGDPDAIGRTLSVDGRPVSIAGVLPADFELPNMGNSEILLPMQLAPGSPQGPTRLLRAFGRLKPGVTIPQAYAALQPLFQQMLKNVPPSFRSEVTLRVRSLHDRQMGDAARTAWLLLAAVGALLLIACVNVTNLLLARLAAREREFAVRAALGAGRSRLARLALTESLLLSLAGCALGLAVAAALLKTFIAMAPSGIPKLAQASLDLRVAGVATLLALVSGMIIGAGPAMMVIRSRSLHGTRATAGAWPWVRFGLVTTQIALTLTMLGSGGLLLRSLWKQISTPLGFDTQSTVTAFLTLNAAKYRAPEQQMAFFDQVLERAQHMPGTISAALSDSLPPVGSTNAIIYSLLGVEGRPPAPRGTGGMIAWRSVTPGYLKTLGISVVRGRDFNEADRRAATPSMIISESLERRLFPGEGAIGRRIKPGSGTQPFHLVVGVAEDVHDARAGGQAVQEYYVARRRAPEDARRSSFLVVRTSASAALAAGFLRQEIATVDPQLPVEIRTMEARVAELSSRPRFLAWLLAAFAGLALALAAAGLYGVASYLVTQRTRDIGVRMALGATPADIARNVLGEAARWVAGGTMAGLALGWISARALQAQLYGVSGADPLSWIGALLVLSIALAIAVTRPVARAARIDPMTVLRVE